MLVQAGVGEEKGIGEGKGKLSEESFPFPSPNPTPSSSKTFDVIESLFAGIFVWAERGGGVLGKGRVWFSFGGKRIAFFLDGKGRRGKVKQQRLASRCFFP